MAQLRASSSGRGRGRGRGTRKPLEPLEDIEGFVDHGWWLSARQDDPNGKFYAVLHILADPIRGETVYSGLGYEYGKVLHISSPRADVGSFFIR